VKEHVMAAPHPVDDDALLREISAVLHSIDATARRIESAVLRRPTSATEPWQHASERLEWPPAAPPRPEPWPAVEMRRAEAAGARARKIIVALIAVVIALGVVVLALVWAR
jgi:hypothetical protein